MSAVLETASGYRLPKLNLTPACIVNKSIALYGPSKSGKTYFTKHILDQINGEVDTAILISPTEPSNQSFAKYIPQPMIHYKMTVPDPRFPKDPTKRIDGPEGVKKFINMVWERQRIITEIFKRANQHRVLKAVFARLPAKAQAAASRECIDKLVALRDATAAKLRKRFRRDPDKLTDEIDKLREKHEEAMCSAYKHYIWNHMEYIWKNHKRFSEDEQYAINYIGLNPKAIIIFDDCASQFSQQLQKKDEFRQYFYQNRHVNLTVIFTFQDDTDLMANLRKNAFLSIYCTSIVCRANFQRAANNWPKEIKSRVEEYIEVVYDRPDAKHLKLAYYRDDARGQNFYYVKGERPKEKMFGSDAYHDVCRALESDQGIDSTNPYYNTFRL